MLHKLVKTSWELVFLKKVLCTHYRLRANRINCVNDVNVCMLMLTRTKLDEVISANGS